MALRINDACIDCDICLAACPNDAISHRESCFVIDPHLCTECVGHHDEPQCVLICPVACIEPDPRYRESPQDLLLKHARLAEQGC